MTTGVPIYLVSACASGEEFVAAFRRYADKNGLFIPIASPIPAGRKGRFAVTLKDGGVMIEGDAEIISSATTPSVLHGRVGMTLRFADLDIKSKTVLVELEQARLAMKPQPPSVPPRPATVPAEPRAKIPTIAGRIDANNALAECVAIGDVDGLEVNAAAQLAKPGPKFVVPSIPPVAGAARPKSPSTPPMPYIAKPTKQGVEPPRATGAPPVIPPPISMTATSPGVAVAKPAPPRPAVPPIEPTPQGMTAVAPPPVKPAVTPMSITTVDAPPITPERLTAATPPAVKPPAITPMSITTVDAPLSITPSSMPTVEPPLVTPTSLGVVSPPKEPAVPRTFSEEVTQFPQVRSAEVFQAIDAEGVPGPVIHDAVPEPLPSTGSKPTGSGRTNLPPPRRSTGTTQPPRMATPATPLPAVGSKVSKPTQIGMPIVDLKPPAPPAAPLPPVVAEAKPAAPELAADEPTDIGGPPVIVEEVPVPQVEDVVPGGLRRTMIGPAVVPDGVTVLPAAQTPAKTDEEDEKRDTALMDAIPRVTPRQPATDPHGETAVAAKVQAALAARPPVIEEPSGDWTMTPGAEGPTIIPRTPETKPRMPTGDWTIARDEDAPDGWGEPSKPDAKAYDPPKPEPKPVRGKEVRVNTGPPVAVVSGEKPLESTMSAKAFDIEEETKAGLKIEVDATLAAEVDSRIAEEAGLASTQFATVQAPLTPPPGTLQPVAMPPQPMPMQSMTMMPAHSMSMALQQPTPIPRPMPPSPGYGDYPQASRQSGAANLFGGVGDSTSLVEVNRRKRLIVILASAGLAVVIGTVLYLVLRKSDEKPTAETKHEVQPPPAVDAAAMIATPAVIDAVAVEEPPVTPDAAVEQASVQPPPQRDCMIEIDSSPSGAVIVRDDQVIGTTPTQIALPCGVATKLVFRKAKLSSVTKTVTASDNARVRVAFAKPMLSVKVTSSPPGATITVGGKSLGVTPAMVKLPANESATLVISKPGFTNDSQKFTPKQNNQSVHFSLKRKGR